MRTRTVKFERVAERGRLDAEYHLAPGVAVRDYVADRTAEGQFEVCKLGGPTGLGEVWQPSRFKRVYASSDEAAIPYLRPYDVFEYLPEPASRLSLGRTAGIDDYRLRAGTILQTCSGRNLGPVEIVDEYLSGFALSHDMVRIEVEDAGDRHYVAAFLKSRAGQAVLRQQISGSVVDHLTVSDVADLDIPMLPAGERAVIAGMQGAAQALYGQGRKALSEILGEVREAYPMAARGSASKAGWTATPHALLRSGRMDAHFHDPQVAAARDRVKEGNGVLLGSVADAFLPGRYKRFYVEREHGRPILSGRQLLQVSPVNLRYISERSFKSIDNMALVEGTVAFGAVGRWEGRLGQPVVVTSDRVDWLASNDVMRLRVKEGAGVTPGWLWLALSCAPVQAQVAALPYGSVVDHTGPEDVEQKVWLPPIDLALGQAADEAWQTFGVARALERQAIAAFETAVFGTEADAWLAA